MKRRKDGRWQKIITANGKRVYFYSVAQTERQAEKDIESQILQYNIDMHQETHNFLSIAEQMLEDKASTISHATYDTYRFALKHFSCFSDLDIENITAKQVQSVLNKMALEHRSMSAISKAKVVFGLVIDYAIIQGLDVNNFMRSVKIPKNVQKSKVSAPESSVIDAIRSASEFEMWSFAMLLIYTGMRRGEILALKKLDVDFENNVIHIWHSVAFVNNQPVVKSIPKTLNSIRDIPILDVIQPILRDICNDIDDNDYLFGKDKPLTESSLKKKWYKYTRLIGYPRLHMHQLRHEYAGILYRSGVDVKTAQGLLGHADIKTTMDIYTDFSKEKLVKSTDIINSYISTL